MPFASKQQQKWAHTSAGTQALGGTAKVNEWDKSTDFSSLPNKKKPKNPAGPVDQAGSLRTAFKK
jgi:hypothetical protein